MSTRNVHLTPTLAVPAAVGVVAVTAFVGTVAVTEGVGTTPVALVFSLLLGILFVAPVGLAFGLATAPLFRRTGVGYLPPETTPALGGDGGWNHHVVAAAYYTALAGLFGFTAVSFGDTVSQRPASAAGAGALLVGTAFVGGQLWRAPATERTTRTAVIWMGFGVALAIPAAGALWFVSSF